MRAKILNASAGAGKTYQLAYHYIRDVVDQPTIYRHILAVTFTNKATEEMKSRILKEIHALAEGQESSYLTLLSNDLGLSHTQIRQRAAEARSRILHDYSRFTVLTIDTFFQRILRAFIKELNLDLNYNIELETASLLTQGADQLIERITSNQELLTWLTNFVEERIEEGRRWDIREGILSLGGEIFKERNKEAIASLRTRAELQELISQATARSQAAAKQLIAQAQALVSKIEEAGASMTDFPQKSRGLAGWIYKMAAGSLAPYGSYVAAALREDDAWGKVGSLSQTLRPLLQPLLIALCRAFDEEVRHQNTTRLLRETYRSFALLGDLYKEVQLLCEKQQLMVLSETKYLLSEFITENDAPFIYEKVGNRFDRFLIDEFQDTSLQEWKNFLPLLRNAMAQTETAKTAVLLVGDVKQSIYRWRGGDWRILHSEAGRALGEGETEVVNLDANWRSLQTIVQFNNESIRRIVEAGSRQLSILLDDAVAAGSIPRTQAELLKPTLSNAYTNLRQFPRRKNSEGGYITIESFDEKPNIIACICQAIDRGYTPSDILILARDNNGCTSIATELLEFKGRHTDPRYRFDVMTQEALIISSASVCDFITATFRLTQNIDESLSIARYNRYLQRPFDAPLPDDEREWLQGLGLLSPEEVFEQIVLFHRLDSRSEETAYLQAIHEQIIGYTIRKVADTALFLRWWEEQGMHRSLAVEQRAATIEISTIHKAKGLERPVILIPYCAWDLNTRPGSIIWSEAHEGIAAQAGSFPIRYKQMMGTSAFATDYYEELVHAYIDHINLLYVAFTRAKEELHIFFPSKQETGKTDALLRSVLHPSPEGRHCHIGELEGRYTLLAENCERFEFGSPSAPRREEKPNKRITHLITHYPTAKADLRLRLPSARYFEEEAKEQFSPRDFGILMHRAFEEAETRDQITQAIDRMEQEGSISAAEAPTLHRMVQEALSNPVVGSWFDSGWEVRNEHQIILPNSGALRRPDRVMISGSRAVVVDYKFGELHADRYRRQIGEYVSLLQKMGYTEVEGWLWYVKQGKVEQVV